MFKLSPFLIIFGACKAHLRVFHFGLNCLLWYLSLVLRLRHTSVWLFFRSVESFLYNSSFSSSESQSVGMQAQIKKKTVCTIVIQCSHLVGQHIGDCLLEFSSGEPVSLLNLVLYTREVMRGGNQVSRYTKCK